MGEFQISYLVPESIILILVEGPCVWSGIRVDLRLLSCGYDDIFEADYGSIMAKWDLLPV